MLAELRDFLSPSFALLLAAHCRPAVFGAVLCLGASIQDARAAMRGRARRAALRRRRV